MPIVRLSEDFSIVLAIAERDAYLVPKSLPSWLSLGARDVVLCVDYPVSAQLREAIRSASGGDSRVRILEVSENKEWLFRQALVRRTGFRAAKYDKVLTGDVDLVVNQNCLKAVEMVGEGNVGLVSLEKRRGGGTLGELIRNLSKKAIKVTKRRALFTGLYAVYKPYWLDTEKEEEVKMIPHPHSAGSLRGAARYLGEDVILRDYMRKRHKIVYLPEVGGKDLRIALEDRPVVQRKMGEGYFLDGRSLSYVLPSSILYARGTTLGVFCDLIVREHGGFFLLREFALTIVSALRRIILHLLFREAGVQMRRFNHEAVGQGVPKKTSGEST